MLEAVSYMPYGFGEEHEPRFDGGSHTNVAKRLRFYETASSVSQQKGHESMPASYRVQLFSCDIRQQLLKRFDLGTCTLP